MTLIAASPGTRIPELEPGMGGMVALRIECRNAGRCERVRRAGFKRESAGHTQTCGKAPATASIFQEFGS